MFDFNEVMRVFLVLFSIIDIIGSIPIIINLRKKHGHIQSEKATVISGVIMVLFLFLGERILGWFGIDVASFAVAGAIVMFLIGMEMVLGLQIFKSDPEEESSSSGASIVPLAFPLIAGAGTITTIISLRAEYHTINILIGILLNLILIYVVLKTSSRIEKLIGQTGFNILHKVFGIILLSIAIKLFKTNLFV